MKRVVVIGGGITGLATAHRLMELAQTTVRPVEVVLLESSAQFGGIVRTEERDGFLLEHGPDSFISEKPAALELSVRIGLEKRLIQTNQEHRRSFVVRRGRLRPVPAGFHLLAPSRLLPLFKSEIFSWSGKARIALEPLVRKREINGDIDESLAKFVRRRLGQEALERMAQPMIGGIYTADPEHLSLRATFPKFLEIERKHGSIIRGLRTERTGEADVTGARYSLFQSFDRGMQVLTDRLAERLSSNTIRLNSRVESVALDHQTGKWHVHTAPGDTISADSLCVTAPAYSAASLLRDVDSKIASELDGIPYESTATVNLAYRRKDITHPLTGFGFVVPAIEGLALIACTFSSVKFAGRAPEGRVLLRAFVGGALQPELFELESCDLLKRVTGDLNNLLGITAEPLFTTVAKWQRSMPQYHVGHLQRVERIKSCLRALPGLALAGSAYSGVGIPDCIRSGGQAAEQIWNQWTSSAAA